MDIMARFSEPQVETHHVTFGAMENEGVTGPNDSPYAAMFVMPRFLWEQGGRPLQVYVRVGDDEIAFDMAAPPLNLWVYPAYKEKK